MEGSYRFRTGGAQNEVHVDFTAGTHPAPRLLILASVYNTFSDGVGAGVYNYKYRYHDIYLSAVYDLNKNISFQLGATGTVAGQNALRQRGPVVGIWFKF